MGLLVYFDCSNGISGDMTLGALLDAGAPLAALRRDLRRLPVKGWRLETEEVKRCGVAGTHAKVVVSKSAHVHHRHYSDIRAMLEDIPLPGLAAEGSRRAFALLAEAEARVHRIPVDRVHFHEVGALDAIIDIVGSMIGLELLGAGRFAASTIAVGSGEVKCDHGILPVPAPATALLLRGAPIEAGPVAMELTTPTGAAILTALRPGFGPMPPMKLKATGYGAGTRVIPGRTNMLRLVAGEPLGTGEGTAEPLERRRLAVLTTEIDDMNPEFYGPLLERLFQAGCLDAFLAPIYMKKGRPGVSVQVLAGEEKQGAMMEILLRHTSSFGVKVIPAERYCLPRKKTTVKTPHGPVAVKIGYWGGEPLKASPEFEDCRRVAEKSGLTLAEVYQSAQEAWARTRSA